MSRSCLQNQTISEDEYTQLPGTFLLCSLDDFDLNEKVKNHITTLLLLSSQQICTSI